MSLGFRPGEILRKPEICAALGISRSPVSEALARLAVEGLVEVAPLASSSPFLNPLSTNGQSFCTRLTH